MANEYDLFHEDGALSVAGLRRLAESASGSENVLPEAGLLPDGGILTTRGPGGLTITDGITRPFWARITGSGSLTTTTLASAMSAADLTLSITSLSPSSASVPSVPFPITVGAERMTVTAVSGTTWSVPNRDLTLATTHPADESILVIGKPYAFLEQRQETPGVFLPHAEGRYGTVEDATVTADAVSTYQAIDPTLVESSGGGYVFTSSIAPAYEANNLTITDGTVVLCWLHPSKEYYLLDSGFQAPLWAVLSGSTAVTASTTLTSAVNSSTTTIPVSSSSGFPTSGTWTATLGSEKVRVTSVNSAGTQWTVTRGVDNTTAAAHLSGSSAGLSLTAYGWTEITQVVRGVWMNKTGGKSSGSDPTVSTNEPAYVLRPGAAVTQNVPVLLWPGPLVSRKYWVFEAPMPAAESTEGIINNTDDQVLGAGRKGVHGLRILPSSSTTIDNSADAKLDQLASQILELTGVVEFHMACLLQVSAADIYLNDSLSEGKVYKHRYGSDVRSGRTADDNAAAGQAVTRIKTSGGIVYDVTTGAVTATLEYGSF